MYCVPVSVYCIPVSVYCVPVSVYQVPVSREGGLLQTVQVCRETDVERKARLEKMVATTQLRLALETEEERRAKNRNEFNLDLISKTFFTSRNELARPVMGTIFLVTWVSV